MILTNHRIYSSNQEPIIDKPRCCQNSTALTRAYLVYLSSWIGDITNWLCEGRLSAFEKADTVFELLPTNLLFHLRQLLNGSDDGKKVRILLICVSTTYLLYIYFYDHLFLLPSHCTQISVKSLHPETTCSGWRDFPDIYVKWFGIRNM